MAKKIRKGHLLKFKIALNKKQISNSYARLSNVRCISEYSMTVDREVVNDRTCARYLVSENIKENVDFDLKKGIDSFIDKSELMKDEGRLDPLCKWACAQEGNDLDKIFCGAQFAGRRGTIRTIAITIMVHNPRFAKPENAWNVIAVKTGNVILLCETSKKYGGVDALGYYSGFKFEQHMTSAQPEKMIRCDIINDDGLSLGICCAAEVDALDGDSSIELQTRQITREFGFFPSLKMVLQAELADINTAVIGWKTENLVVTKIPISNFKPILKRADENSLAFLFAILRITKTIMASKDACEINYDPSNGAVEFNYFSKEEAMNLLTPEFKKKFNLRDQDK
ncbi:hypothetical protein PRIPAC_73724 [Pristionchus pacificus]|uniref:Decapping nuclease n=1 Tax=Pristionchus pacificus TaxID=54126 RepID=A0A2A6CZB7_PRIPA|nr:hypothetical protein PRIPAC_73724 [Pristionchus pacificus]|eukprot:PDM83562.1 hypothetical protein PRIPAC_30049 [Pristionchus pacificus]